MKNILYVLIGMMTGFVLAAILLVVTRLPGGQPVSNRLDSGSSCDSNHRSGGQARSLYFAGRKPRTGRGGRGGRTAG